MAQGKYITKSYAELVRPESVASRETDWSIDEWAEKNGLEVIG